MTSALASATLSSGPGRDTVDSVELMLELREQVAQGLCLVGVELWEEGWITGLAGAAADIVGAVGADAAVVCDAVTASRVQPS